MDVEIRILTKIEPKEFVLVNGLPGIAYVGKLSVDYLIQQLKAELVGEVYSKYFPPYVIIRSDGIVELLKNEFYRFRDDTGTDIMFLTGNSQALSPEGQYEVSEKVLDWAISNGLRKVFSIAALATDKPFEKPSVYGTATTDGLLKEMKKHQVIPLEAGIISGENGLIMGLAKKRNIDAICLFGETRGYQTPDGQFLLDPRAAKAVLEVLSSILNLDLDMDPLDKQANEAEKVIARIQQIQRRAIQEMSKATRKPTYVT